MDGNHSVLAFVSDLIRCSDVQPPLILSVILGLPANMCVMWLILAGPGDKASEIFSLNQAICEVAISIANAIMLIAINVKISSVVTFTYFWYTFRISMGFLFSGRPLFMSCVCLERYLAVVHPVTFLKYKLLRYKLTGTIISWLTVLACCTLLVRVPFPAIQYVCFGMAFSGFLTQLFFCVTTLCALVRPGPREGNQETNRMNSVKLRACRIITVILVSLVVTYLPYFVSVILLILSKESNSQMFCITTYAALVSGFIPPFLYIYRAGKLQHCIKDTLEISA